jgi:DNA-binding CsgD family transcriptional regulator
LDGERVGHYRELSATTTTTDRESYMHGRVSEGESEQDYQRILLIREEMVEL